MPKKLLIELSTIYAFSMRCDALQWQQFIRVLLMKSNVIPFLVKIVRNTPKNNCSIVEEDAC